MATVYFTASSLDGFIVDDADSLDWLTSRAVDPEGPFGYEAFAKSVGALAMGSATYEWIVTNHPGDWMYEQPSWVLTSRPDVVEPGIPCRRSTATSPNCTPNSCRPPRTGTCGWSAAVTLRRSSWRRA